MTKTMIEMLLKNQKRIGGMDVTGYGQGYQDAISDVLSILEMDNCEVLDAQEV